MVEKEIKKIILGGYEANYEIKNVLGKDIIVLHTGYMSNPEKTAFIPSATNLLVTGYANARKTPELLEVKGVEEVVFLATDLPTHFVLVGRTTGDYKIIVRLARHHSHGYNVHIVTPSGVTTIPKEEWELLSQVVVEQ